MYSLERKSYTQVIKENFSDTLKSLTGFVTCSSLTGIGIGIIYNMNITEFSLDSDERIIPTITAIGAVYYAKKVYDNFKKDRARVHQLAIEMDKERKKRMQEELRNLDGFITPDQLLQLKNQQILDKSKNILQLESYRNILTSQKSAYKNSDEQITGDSNNKRMSLNNGIFKSNDKY